MTASGRNKYGTVLYDKKGKPVMAQLNLRNEAMRRAYEKAIEELEDEEDVKEAMVRDDGQGRPFDEFVAEYMAENGNG